MSQTQDLIIVENDTPLADSREIAKKLGVDHRSFFRLITEYQEEIEKDFGIMRLEIAEIKGRGQPQKYALLNEDQTYTLMMYTQNTEQARMCKRLLVKAFKEAKQALAQAQQLWSEINEEKMHMYLERLRRITEGHKMDDVDYSIASINLYHFAHSVIDLRELIAEVRATFKKRGTVLEHKIVTLLSQLEQTEHHMTQVEKHLKVEEASHDMLMGLYISHRAYKPLVEEEVKKHIFIARTADDDEEEQNDQEQFEDDEE